MTQTTVFCDSCGCRVLENRTALKVNSGPIRRTATNVDLCGNCGDSFAETLSALRNTSVDKEVARQPLLPTGV